MGEICNRGGDNGGGIYFCSKTRAETKGVFVMELSIMEVSIMGFDISGFDSGGGIGIDSEIMD